MLFPELLARVAHAADARAHVGPFEQYVTIVPSLTRHSSMAGYVIVTPDAGSFQLGYIERGSLVKSAYLRTESAAAQEMWDIVSREIAAGMRPMDPRFLTDGVRPGRPYRDRFRAADPSSAPGVLEALERSDDPGVRWEVALNPATSPDTLERLSSDADFGVRWAAAANPSTPAGALAAMVDHADVGVAVMLARNPATPSDALARLRPSTRR